ncbi:hypothetical protein [Micromonospora sp. C81]|uniref:hypothetical protein n=1 Tax=Micromonospora sp. C81 TaxID=2824881 RepID=UPI001B387D42|nr:hypothetical protein [Micromonospora sp. C81]MBQ1040783.1 hypothetical protein [Micromonospora sp. C81]
MVTGWIAQTQAERARAEADLPANAGTPARRMSRAEITALVDAFGDITAVLRDADPADVYRQLGLRLNYQPGTQTVRAAVDLSTHREANIWCPRGDTTHCPTADDAQRNSEAHASLGVVVTSSAEPEEVTGLKGSLRTLPVGSVSQMTELRGISACSPETLYVDPPPLQARR